MVPSSGGKGALPLHQHFFSLAKKWNLAPKKNKKNKKSDFGGFYWGKNQKKNLQVLYIRWKEASEGEVEGFSYIGSLSKIPKFI
jgi:hypothetical protein